MKRKELNKILENHKHWLNEDIEGWEEMKADLSNTDLRGANIRNADLCYADLRNADLQGADLRDADLCYADLRGANIRNADLCYADLRNANLYIPLACPDSGSFIGWKKAGGKIVCLEILEDAKRLSATGRKCRCDKAKVLRIENSDGTACEEKEVTSYYDKNFVYKVGEMVQVDNFNEDRWNECSAGIHFFINRQEAVNY